MCNIDFLGPHRRTIRTEFLGLCPQEHEAIVGDIRIQG
jgi:hypothetical protein